MPAPVMQPALVWSGRLRLAHWFMALSVLVLLASGWLLAQLPAQRPLWREVHGFAGYGLLLALGLRTYLLLWGRAAEHWRDLVPRGPQVRAAWHTLRFYLSLGRAPLPAWYAHNPLWSPIYVAWWLLLCVQVGTGWMPEQLAALGLQPWRWHSLVADGIAMLVLAHVVAVFVHDLKGGGADVSAMINGMRWFRSARPPSRLAPPQVSLDDLLRKKSKSDR